MHKTVCALCLKSAELHDSHIIPNAYFRRMKRDNSGKLIVFDSSDYSQARQSIESWSQYLLCGVCEQRISKWETASIKMLRKTGEEIKKSGNHGALMQGYDYPTLRLFLLSILWRASISTLSEFAEIVLPSGYEENLRQTLHLDGSDKALTMNCRMMKIVDEAKIIDATNFENIAVSPFIEPVIPNCKFTFIFGGYVSEFFVPRMPFRLNNLLGVLRSEQKQFIPTIDMTELPRLMNLFVAGYQKGLSNRQSC
jgi:hypothetical protein